jgi:hypothetical protein
MNIPDHISESLETIFVGLKIIKFADAEPDPGSEIFLTLDPGSATLVIAEAFFDLAF